MVTVAAPPFSIQLPKKGLFSKREHRYTALQDSYCTLLLVLPTCKTNDFSIQVLTGIQCMLETLEAWMARWLQPEKPAAKNKAVAAMLQWRSRARLQLRLFVLLCSHRDDGLK